MAIFQGVGRKAEICLQSHIDAFGIESEKHGELVYESKAAPDKLKWRFEFLQNKTLFSQVYKFKVITSFHLDNDLLPEKEVICRWILTKKEWRMKGERNQSFLDYLNKQSELTRLFFHVDFESIEAVIIGNQVSLSLTPVPGCFLFLLIPPIRYFVKFNKEEIELIKKAMFKFQKVVEEYGMKTCTPHEASV